MKPLSAGLGLIWLMPLIFPPPVAAGWNFHIVRNGNAACTIVLAKQPSRAAQLAALELQSHV